MKGFTFLMGIFTLLLLGSTANAQDGVTRMCNLFDTGYSSTRIELGCKLIIEQPAALPDISEVGFDHHPRGYYRHCWDDNSTSFQVANNIPYTKPYPSSGPVDLEVEGYDYAAKFWFTDNLIAHWVPLVNRAQYWYREDSSGNRVDYLSPVSNSIEWKPSPCS